MTEAYPLRWPDGEPRTPAHGRKRDNKFHDRNDRLSVGKARDQLLRESRLAGFTDIIVSSNVPTRTDGLLYADNKRIEDPGIAVYFKFKGKSLVMARDDYISVAGNLRELALAIQGMRQMLRHGSDRMIEQAFTGFIAIAPPDWKKPWRQVCGVKPDWNGDLKALYREKARERHPDAGGSDTLMAELNVAYEEGCQELGQSRGTQH